MWRAVWEAFTGMRDDSDQRLATIDKIENVRRAVEDGLQDTGWANERLRQLVDERRALISARERAGTPPQFDGASITAYMQNSEKLFNCVDPAERKRLLRSWIQEIPLKPEDLEVKITYRLPEAVMNGVVVGGGFEPPTFGL